MQRTKGFTLIEMLLVIVIMSSIVIMIMGILQQKTQEWRLDKTSLQTQQILNAALSYYVVNNSWPGDSTNDPITVLQTNGFLPQVAKTKANPNGAILNPWGSPYAAGWTKSTASSATPTINSGSVFYVYTDAATASNANIIAGRLPQAYLVAKQKLPITPIPSLNLPTPSTTPTDTGVIAVVNIPGQNLNNATAVNFTSLYHNGACVPAPECPVDTSGTPMVPEITVVPVQVSGNVDSTSGVPNVYPISSYTAYAIGDSKGQPIQGQSGGFLNNCDTTQTTPQACPLDTTIDPVTGKPDPGVGIDTNRKYWRVCLSVTTEKGPVPIDPTGAISGGTVMAITRCHIDTEHVGSGFNVWGD